MSGFRNQILEAGEEEKYNQNLEQQVKLKLKDSKDSKSQVIAPIKSAAKIGLICQDTKIQEDNRNIDDAKPCKETKTETHQE